jgi:hypothetical protein
VNIHLPAQITANDYGDAQLLHQRARRYAALVLLALGAIFLAILVTGDFADLSGLSFQLFMVALILFLIYRVSPLGTRRRTAKLFEQSKGLQIPHEIDITETHVIMRSSERGEWKVPWSDFLKWKSHQRLILVYPSPGTYHIFPRRWFASDDEFQSFKDLLARTIGPAGKAKKRA